MAICVARKRDSAFIALQLLFPDGVLAAFQEVYAPELLERELPGTDCLLTNLHKYAGIANLLLANVRVWLRFTHGVPPLPEDEPPVMKLAVQVTHAALYAVVFLMPLTGVFACCFGSEVARE